MHWLLIAMVVVMILKNSTLINDLYGSHPYDHATQIHCKADTVVGQVSGTCIRFRSSHFVDSFNPQLNG